jgi:hypothetical protein
MNIRCFLGFHDWYYLDTYYTYWYESNIYDKVCLRCKKRDNQIEERNKSLEEQELKREKRRLLALKIIQE